MIASPFLLSSFIEHHGLDLQTTRLARHDRRGLGEWRHSVRRFDSFASIQRPESDPYRKASHVLQFVPGPSLPDGWHSAEFVGAHRITDRWALEPGGRLPTCFDPTSAWQGKDGHLLFELERIEGFEPFVERLVIRWGTSTRSWSQWAHRNPKEIIELRRVREEPAFPGFAALRCHVEDVPVLPATWRNALASVRGIYLLVCPDTGEQYVGSAYGENGFLGRWTAYAENGHGGNQLLKKRRRSNYVATVLEVSSADAAPSEIIQRESAWKEKLGSRAHGLNAN